MVWTEPIVAMVLVGVSLLIGGLLVIAIADRTADGRMGRNGYAGIRTQATRSCDAAWLAAHEAAHSATKLGGATMIAAGPAAAVVGLVAGGGEPGPTMLWWGVTCMAFTVALTALIVYGSVRGHRVAVEVQGRAGTVPA